MVSSYAEKGNGTGAQLAVGNAAFGNTFMSHRRAAVVLPSRAGG